jgi:hypothetical protein
MQRPNQPGKGAPLINREAGHVYLQPTSSLAQRDACSITTVFENKKEILAEY